MSDYEDFSRDLLKQGHKNIKKRPDIVTPSHVIAAKKVEIEERKLKLQQDALRMAVLGKMLGGKEIVDGTITSETPGRLGEGQD